MEKITLKQIKILIFAFLAIGFAISISINFYFGGQLKERTILLEERTIIYNQLIQQGRDEVFLNIINQLRQTGQLQIKVGTTTDEVGEVIDRLIILRPTQ